MAFTYGIRLLISVMKLVLNRCVGRSCSNWYTMIWLVFLVIGSVPTAYANPAFNTTSWSEAPAAVPFGTSLYETVNLSIGLVWSLSVAAYNDSTSTDARRKPGVGIWGVGIPVPCRPDGNRILDSTSEFDKVASAVASTIMFLVPTLLSFADLPTASIKNLLSFNTEAAFCTAAMTLGLRNKSLSTLRSTAMIEGKEFCKGMGLHVNCITLPGSCACGISINTGCCLEQPPAPNSSPPGRAPVFSINLTGYEETSASGSGLTTPPAATPNGSPPGTETLLGGNLPIEGELAFGHNRTDSNLGGQSIKSTRPGVYDKYHELGKLQERMLMDVDKRFSKLFITVVTTGFAFTQLCLFGVFVIWLPQIDDIKFVWICMGPVMFTWWVGSAALLSGISRIFALSSFVVKDEVFHLSPMPRSITMVWCEECSVAVRPLPTRTARERLRDFFTCAIEEITALPRYSKNQNLLTKSHYLELIDIYM